MWEPGSAASPAVQGRSLAGTSARVEAAGAAAQAGLPQRTDRQVPAGDAAVSPEAEEWLSALRALERDLEALRSTREAAGRKLLEAEGLLQTAQKAVSAAQEGLSLSAQASATIASAVEAGKRLLSLAGKNAPGVRPAISAVLPAEGGRQAGEELLKQTADREQAPAVAMNEPHPAPQPAPQPQSDARFLTGPLSVSDNRFSRRVRVKTRARIRRPGSSEVVEPVDLSRSGVCFKSALSYEVDSTVWVSMHYRDNDPGLIETRTRIVRVVQGPGGALFYGAKFVRQ